MTNRQAKLRTAPDLCKKFSHAVFFGSNNNSNTIFMQSYIYIYIHIYIINNIERLIGQKKFKKKQAKNDCRVPFWISVPYVCKPCFRVP